MMSQCTKAILATRGLKITDSIAFYQRNAHLFSSFFLEDNWPLLRSHPSFLPHCLHHPQHKPLVRLSSSCPTVSKYPPFLPLSSLITDYKSSPLLFLPTSSAPFITCSKSTKFLAYCITSSPSLLFFKWLYFPTAFQ